MENIIDTFEMELRALAEQHRGAASNEHLWALGSQDSETSAMHEQNAEEHSMLAEMYDKMADRAEELVEQYIEG